MMKDDMEMRINHRCIMMATTNKTWLINHMGSSDKDGIQIGSGFIPKFVKDRSWKLTYLTGQIHEFLSRFSSWAFSISKTLQFLSEQRPLVQSQYLTYYSNSTSGPSSGLKGHKKFGVFPPFARGPVAHKSTPGQTLDSLCCTFTAFTAAAAATSVLLISLCALNEELKNVKIWK